MNKSAHHVKASFSKYDLVKVKVYLSEKHYYVLSRFLVSRVLTAAKVSHEHAVRMALDLKKRLVDLGELDITQATLETHLFDLMRSNAFGYGEPNINLYRMMSRFHHHRIPMIVLISGAGCVGKSSLATQLAERLNLPSVLKADVVYAMMRTSFKVIDSPHAVWDSCPDSVEKKCPCHDFMKFYDGECKKVEEGLIPDIRKYIVDGKSCIIEGTHIRASLYENVLKLVKEVSASKDDGKFAENGAVVVPMLVHMDDEASHLKLWKKSRRDQGMDMDTRCFENSRLIQKRLIDEMSGGTKVESDVKDFEQTLNAMHAAVLHAIEGILLNDVDKT